MWDTLLHKHQIRDFYHKNRVYNIFIQEIFLLNLWDTPLHKHQIRDFSIRNTVVDDAFHWVYSKVGSTANIINTVLNVWPKISISVHREFDGDIFFPQPFVGSIRILLYRMSQWSIT